VAGSSSRFGSRGFGPRQAVRFCNAKKFKFGSVGSRGGVWLGGRLKDDGRQREGGSKGRQHVFGGSNLMQNAKSVRRNKQQPIRSESLGQVKVRKPLTKR